MSGWQRRARLVIGAFAALFVVLLALAFRRHSPPRAPTSVIRTDSAAVVESSGGKTGRFTGSHEGFRVDYKTLLTYADGSSRLVGVTIVTEERGGSRTFTVTGKEGKVGQNESTIALDGDVRLASSDGISARTEHATYSTSDGSVDAAGPVDFVRGRVTGKGVGLKYEKARDVLSILDQAAVHAAPDEKGGGAADITAGRASFPRRDKDIQLERHVRIQRGTQVSEAETALARLSPDEKRIESIELHDHARITEGKGGPGGLQSLAGNNMNLVYATGGETLERVIMSGDAMLKLNGGEPGQAGRQIDAKLIEVVMAPDGSTPVSLTGRDGVQLTFPPEPGAPGRTIRAAQMDAKGEAGRGLTRALFTGGAQYRERGGDVDRAANSGTLEVTLKPGLSTIEEARFAHAVRFEEGKLVAQAAAARYDVHKGSLDLSGSEPGAIVPRVVNDQIAVDGTKIDITLEGPRMEAAGMVKSTIQPTKQEGAAPGATTPAGRAGPGSAPRAPSASSPARPAGSSSGGTPGASTPPAKMPSMLKQDQPVSVVAESLAYDGTVSKATYSGAARLFQGDTTIKADTLVLDQRVGDLAASGHVMTTTTQEQAAKEGKRPQRVQSTATGDDLKYEDAIRRLTYTGGAHLVGPEGDVSASRIELYLNPAGDDVERAEAYAEGSEKMTLREQNRTTTGARLTYTAAQETYVVTGLPALVVDECGRETTGKTLTMVKSTDTIVVDGNQQIRTETKGGNGKCS